MNFELPKDLKIYAIKKICIRLLICLAEKEGFVLACGLGQGRL